MFRTMRRRRDSGGEVRIIQEIKSDSSRKLDLFVLSEDCLEGVQVGRGSH